MRDIALSAWGSIDAAIGTYVELWIEVKRKYMLHYLDLMNIRRLYESLQELFIRVAALRLLTKKTFCPHGNTSPHR